jgi:hypothetical protein
MEARIENDKLIVTVDLEKPHPSASGKTLVVASSYGNVLTQARVNDRNVTVGLNAYIKP